MTVRELVKQLEEFDPDLEVYIRDVDSSSPLFDITLHSVHSDYDDEQEPTFKDVVLMTW